MGDGTKPPAKKYFENAVSLDLFFVNVYLFYLHEDIGSLVLNIFEINKHLNTMQNYWVVQIKWQN